MYYVYLLDGVKNFYSIKQLQEVFYKSKSLTNNSSASSETNIFMSNVNQQKLIVIENANMNNSPRERKDNETVKCSTCNASPFMATPEKDQLNQYSYIFDLHHMPIFDDNTGEFFWNNNEANWKTARDSIFRSEEINNGKSLSMNHGSLVSLSNSFMGGMTGNNVINTTNSKKDGDQNDQKWANFKNDLNSGTIIEELNKLLKEFE